MDQKNQRDYKKEFNNKLTSYIKAIFLPLLLVVLFVIQNQLFNIWLNIYSKDFLIRLSLVSFSLGIILYGPSIFLKKKKKYIYLFLISFLVTSIFISQFLYYKYSQGFLQFSSIKYLNQAGSVYGTIKTLFTPQILLFCANLIIVIIAVIIALKNKNTEIVLPKSEKIITVLVMILLVFFGYKHLLDTEKKEWGNTTRLYARTYDLRSFVGKIGITNFFLQDTYKYVLKNNLITENDKNFLKVFAENIDTDKNQKKYFGAAKGKNLIIIQIESLENVVINKTINGQEITPNLNKLIKEGLYFNNYYAQTGPGNTADTEFTTLTSLYPLPNDVVFISYAKNNYKALPKLLTENGYNTYSFHGDVPSFWNRSNIYPQLGYQQTFNLDDYTLTRPVGQGPSNLGDEDFFSQSLVKIKTLKEPFMATLITLSSHTPFILPDDLQKLKIAHQTNLTQTQWGYMQSIHYADKAVGDFIDNLKKTDLYDNSLIFIWGDHQSFQNIYSVLSTENLNADQETAQLYKALDVGFINKTKENKDIPLVLANNQIPMIILAPGTNLKGTSNIPSSHLDIYPTIANLLGVNIPKNLLGQDLLNTKNPVVTLFKNISGGISAILTNKLEYITSDDGIFENGSCKSLPERKILATTECFNLYEEQLDTIKVSDIIVRGNLLDLFLASLKN